jgi:glycosyltransferase involved in cell wall biosynthesis
MRVAVVHERFTELGGSELVVEQLLRIWPEATLFAPIVDRTSLPPGLSGHRIEHGFLQRAYAGDGRYAHLLPLMPLAMRAAPLARAELVITSHHAFSNRVRPPAGVPVISYVHSPARWMWEPRMRAGEGGVLTRAGLRSLAAANRHADVRAAQRIDALVANSSAVANRVRRWWNRSAAVVAPPVNVERYTPDDSTRREDFFLLAGRLVPYKRPEIAVAAAKAAGVRLVVAGDGRSRSTLERTPDPRITFVGRVGDDELRDLYRRCRALIFPGEEDFGIVPVEAMACGAPVIALDAGGAQDSVVDGITGVLVPVARSPADQVAWFRDALEGFRGSAFDPSRIRRRAEQFDADVFRRRFEAAVDSALARRARRSTVPSHVLTEQAASA